MRAFVGLPVPEPMVAPLLRLQGGFADGRPVSEEALHLTLAFLGEIDEETAAEVHEALDGRRLRACTLVPEGLAAYGGTRPKLLAMDIRSGPDLVALQADVARAVRQAGVHLERRRFRPHVTLMRFGSGLSPAGDVRLHRALAETKVPDLRETTARVACLYRSHLGPGGAQYEALAQYVLA